jgi:hypothetical protein
VHRVLRNSRFVYQLFSIISWLLGYIQRRDAKINIGDDGRGLIIDNCDCGSKDYILSFNIIIVGSVIVDGPCFCWHQYDLQTISY